MREMGLYRGQRLDDRRAAHIRFLRMAADGKLPITNKALLADIRRELASIGEGRKLTIEGAAR